MASKVGIIGASASGIYVALLFAKKSPETEIHLFDRADRIGKKLLATGNGHCNLMHVPFKPEAFNHPDFVEQLLEKASEEDLLKALQDLGIETMAKDELLYPLSYSAASHVHFLGQSLKKSGVHVHLNETIVSVNGQTIATKTGSYAFDDLIFAFGGKSQSNLGSDGSLFPVLKSVGYEVVDLRPSLCPLKSPDVDRCLFGVRHPALVTLSKVGKTLYQERGEVQFKEDALSGIAIMNASSKYEIGCEVSLDLFPDLDEADLAQKIYRSRISHGPAFLDPFLCKELVEFVLKNEKIQAETPLNLPKCRHIAHFLKDMRFRISGLYGFESSQVTRGGIALSEIDGNLAAKKNPHHRFVGECLDVDGLCGGYNLGFALLSAMIVANSL